MRWLPVILALGTGIVACACSPSDSADVQPTSTMPVVEPTAISPTASLDAYCRDNPGSAYCALWDRAQARAMRDLCSLSQCDYEAVLLRSMGIVDEVCQSSPTLDACQERDQLAAETIDELCRTDPSLPVCQWTEEDIQREAQELAGCVTWEMEWEEEHPGEKAPNCPQIP